VTVGDPSLEQLKGGGGRRKREKEEKEVLVPLD